MSTPCLTDINNFLEKIAAVSKDGKDTDGKSGVDIFKWLNFLTFDITTDLSFGESFDTVKTGEWLSENHRTEPNCVRQTQRLVRNNHQSRRSR